MFPAMNIAFCGAGPIISLMMQGSRGLLRQLGN